MNRLTTFFALLTLCISTPALHGQGVFIFRYPPKINKPDSLEFGSRLADTLKQNYGLSPGQVEIYETLLKEASSRADTSQRFTREDEIEGVRQRKSTFEQKVKALLKEDQLGRWESEWKTHHPQAVASMLFPYFTHKKRLIFLDRQWDTLQEKILAAQNYYTALLGEILKVDSLTANKLFVEELLLNEYVNRPEIRMWGISQEQALLLSMCWYEHDARRRAIEERKVSSYMKDVSRQIEDEILWQSIIDSLGYDFYCDWYDYNQLKPWMLDFFKVPPGKMDEFRKIQKQLEIERARINRGTPELDGEEKQRRIEEAGKRRDAALKKLAAGN